VAEGNVGGGTGMICHGFKGGIGTSSRRISVAGTTYTLGVLAQANHGSREQLTISGVRVGREIGGEPEGGRGGAGGGAREGSIIVVVATDAPLLPHQLSRLARRVPMGIARVGGTAANGSGDIFIAFSTANPGAARSGGGPVSLEMLPNESQSAFFTATIEAVEESIVNALVAAETMSGKDGLRIEALPHERLLLLLRKHDSLQK
jgi:L-aminopeptidase/D-esterase-like protein